MSKSRDIFPFNVFEEIKNNKTVYAIDKAYPADGIMVVNEMPVEHAVYLINSDTAVFWNVETKEETE